MPLELILWKAKVSLTKWRRTLLLLVHQHSSLVDQPQESKHRRPLRVHILHLFKDLRVEELLSWEIEAWKAKGSTNTIKNVPDLSPKAAVAAVPKTVLAPEDHRELVESLETLKW